MIYILTRLKDHTGIFFEHTAIPGTVSELVPAKKNRQVQLDLTDAQLLELEKKAGVPRGHFARGAAFWSTEEPFSVKVLEDEPKLLNDEDPYDALSLAFLRKRETVATSTSQLGQQKIKYLLISQRQTEKEEVVAYDIMSEAFAIVHKIDLEGKKELLALLDTTLGVRGARALSTDAVTTRIGRMAQANSKVLVDTFNHPDRAIRFELMEYVAAELVLIRGGSSYYLKDNPNVAFAGSHSAAVEYLKNPEFQDTRLLLKQRLAH